MQKYLARAVVLLALFVAAAIVLRPFRIHERLLFDSAKPVPGTAGIAKYLWRSDRELLALTTIYQPVGPAAYQPFGPGFYGRGGGSSRPLVPPLLGPPLVTTSAVLVNASNGGRVELGRLSKMLTAHGGAQLSYACLSPEGAGLIVPCLRPFTKDLPTFCWMALDGSKTRRWKANGNLNGGVRPAIFMPDGRSWIEWTFIPRYYDGGWQVYLHSIEAPDKPGIRLRLPVGAYSILGILPPSRIITSDFGGSDGYPKGIQIFETELGAQKETRIFLVHPPSNAVVAEISLSPRGDRLAWRLGFLTPRDRSPSALGSVISWFDDHTGRSGNGLWVSRLDGSDLHEIGHVSIRDLKSQFGSLGWTPDGKRISFMAQGRVYTIPAD